jgi:hypothetical protein
MPITLGATGSTGVTPVSFQQVTVSSTAVGLSIPTGVRPRMVFLSVNTNGIRYRLDGSDPTSTVGHVAAAAGGPSEAIVSTGLLGERMILNFRMIRNGATDAEVAYTIAV